MFSEKEAAYHLYHSEEELKMGCITKDILEERMESLLNALAGFNKERAQKECKRINLTYGFHFTVDS